MKTKSSTYRWRPLAAGVLLHLGRYAVIRQRHIFEAMIAGKQPVTHRETA